MEISLVRHGKSRHTNNKRMTCKEFGQWVEKYDESGVFKPKTHRSKASSKITSAQLVVTSDLKRAAESAELLGVHSPLVSAAVFREIELPRFGGKKQFLKLKPNTWTVVLRSLWVMGYAHGCHSLREEKSRAEAAAKQLIEYAHEYTSVVLVGHGVFNGLIAKELKKANWKSNKKINLKHWARTTYFSSE